MIGCRILSWQINGASTAGGEDQFLHVAIGNPTLIYCIVSSFGSISLPMQSFNGPQI